MITRAAGRPVEPDELTGGEAEVMQHLAVSADPARWAELRDRVNRDFAEADQLNLDRKQAIIGAIFAFEEVAR